MFPTGVSVLGDPDIAQSAMGEVTHYANKTSFMRRQSGLGFISKTHTLENGGVTHVVENAYVRLVYVDVRGVPAEGEGRRRIASDDERALGGFVVLPADDDHPAGWPVPVGAPSADALAVLRESGLRLALNTPLQAGTTNWIGADGRVLSYNGPSTNRYGAVSRVPNPSRDFLYLLGTRIPAPAAIYGACERGGQLVVVTVSATLDDTLVLYTAPSPRGKLTAAAREGFTRVEQLVEWSVLLQVSTTPLGVFDGDLQQPFHFNPAGTEAVTWVRGHRTNTTLYGDPTPDLVIVLGVNGSLNLHSQFPALPYGGTKSDTKPPVVAADYDRSGRVVVLENRLEELSTPVISTVAVGSFDRYVWHLDCGGRDGPFPTTQNLTTYSESATASLRMNGAVVTTMSSQCAGAFTNGWVADVCVVDVGSGGIYYETFTGVVDREETVTVLDADLRFGVLLLRRAVSAFDHYTGAGYGDAYPVSRVTGEVSLVKDGVTLLTVNEPIATEAPSPSRKWLASGATRHVIAGAGLGLPDAAHPLAMRSANELVVSVELSPPSDPAESVYLVHARRGAAEFSRTSFLPGASTDYRLNPLRTL